MLLIGGGLILIAVVFLGALILSLFCRMDMGRGWGWRGMIATSFQVFSCVWAVYVVAPGVAVLVFSVT